MSRLACLFAALPVVAIAEISLILPVDCTLGETCVIQQFLDHDPGPAVSDFRCDQMSYDGHKGTDFALPDLAAMRAGVAVLAAADGVVAATRDGMEDALQGGPDAPDVTGRECGNGVVLVHPNGYETQYCHMRRGTVSVREGDQVTAGQRLGLIGLSGETQFPHLHLAVRRNGEEIDPFDPDGAITCDDPDAETLWADMPPPAQGGLLGIGFATGVPEFDAIKDGLPSEASMPRDVPALVLWGHMYASRAGDRVEIAFTGPEGEAFATEETLEKGQAQLFRAGGRRTPEGGWPAGTYTGQVTLWRGDAPLDSRTITVTITD